MASIGNEYHGRHRRVETAMTSYQLKSGDAPREQIKVVLTTRIMTNLMHLIFPRNLFNELNNLSRDTSDEPQNLANIEQRDSEATRLIDHNTPPSLTCEVGSDSVPLQVQKGKKCDSPRR